MCRFGLGLVPRQMLEPDSSDGPAMDVELAMAAPSVVARKSLHWIKCSVWRVVFLARTKPQCLQRTLMHCGKVRSKYNKSKMKRTYLLSDAIVEEFVKVFVHVEVVGLADHGGRGLHDGGITVGRTV